MRAKSVRLLFLLASISLTTFSPLFSEKLFRIKSPRTTRPLGKFEEKFSFIDSGGDLRSFSCSLDRVTVSRIQRSHEIPLCPKDQCRENMSEVCAKSVIKRNLCFNISNTKNDLPDPFSAIMWKRGFRCDRRSCLKGEECSSQGEKAEWARDYSRYMNLSSNALADCMASFDRETVRSAENLEALLLTTRLIDPRDIDEEDRRRGVWTANFRSPASAIHEGGDCDSRAALLAVLIGNNQRKVVIFRSIRLWSDLTGHGTALVGVEKDGGNEQLTEKVGTFGQWATTEIKAGDEEAEVNGVRYTFIPVMKSAMRFGVIDSAWAGLYRVIPIRADNEIVPSAGTPCVKQLESDDWNRLSK